MREEAERKEPYCWLGSLGMMIIVPPNIVPEVPDPSKFVSVK